MLRKTIIALCSLAMVAATLAAPGSTPVQAQTNLRLITEFVIPGSNDVKWPHVAARNGLVTVSGNVNEQSAVVWTKAAGATAFGTPFEVGPAEDTPDWSSTSVAVGPDGSTWVAWVNQPERVIYIRERNAIGQWGPARVVARGSGFSVNVEVAVSSSNQIFVAWRDVDRPIRFSVSLNRGEAWSSRQNVSDLIAFRGAFGLAPGPNGAMGVAFTGSANDRLQIFAGLWNGSSFTVNRVTPENGDWADPTIAFGANGRPFVAWRGVAESGGNAGAWFSEQQPGGAWPTSRLIGGSVVGNVGVSADEQGNIHFGWVGEPSGARSVFYAFKPSTGATTGPIGSNRTGALFGPRIAGGIAESPFGHVVSEEFSGSRLFTLYSLFAGSGVSFGGEPVLEGSAPRSDGVSRATVFPDGTVKLTFRSLTGSPNQVRWRWGAAPTDTASDSSGWQALGTEMRIPVPSAILNNTSCQPVSLFTQLRNTASNTTEPQARQYRALVDGVVEAQVYLNNPFFQASPEAIARGGSLAGIQGAPGGAPNYTRVPITWLNIVSDTDCSGITVAGVGPAADKIEQSFIINDGAFSGLIALPNLANLKPGRVPFVVRVQDGAGNTRIFEIEVILDERKPTLEGGTVRATGNPDGDLLQTLTFENIQVSDDQFPLGYWGIWVANAVEPVADPLNDPSLTWTVIEAPDERTPGNGFVYDDWSLATGLTREQLVPGEDYFIYIRFLDGAGNPTDGFITVPVARSSVDRPDTYLPKLRR